MQPRQAAAGESVISSELASLAALDRHLSVPLVFSLLAAAAFFIAWNRGIALMHAMVALFAAIAVVSVAAAAWMLRRARVRFVLPKQASVGETATIFAALEPLAWPRRRRSVELTHPFPFAPSCNVFLASAGAGDEVASKVHLARRGVFTLADVAARCAYPIGLFALRRKWPVEPAGITVFPRVHPVTRFPSAASSARVSGEVERPSPSLGQELFREVRDYRSGDNPRHIHWRTSARRGQLVVKQFDAIATSETWIVLDLDPASHAGEGARHSLEVAIEIAATIASHVVRSGLRCGIAGGLASDGSFALWHAPAAGAPHLDTLMHALARVQAQPSLEYGKVLAALCASYRRGQQWILFNHGPRTLSAPPALRGDAALWFLVESSSFDEPTSIEPTPPRSSRGGIVVGADTDLAAVFR